MNTTLVLMELVSLTVLVSQLSQQHSHLVLPTQQASRLNMPKRNILMALDTMERETLTVLESQGVLVVRSLLALFLLVLSLL